MNQINMAKQQEIPAFKMGSASWKKFWKGVLIAGGGALATILEDLIPGLDFGQYTVVIMGVNSVLINLLKLWMTKQKA